MKVYHFIVSSRNKKSLDNFEQFFLKVIKLKFNILNVFYKKKKKKKLLTILKSPHVNKIAQEQFEFKIYSQIYIIYLLNESKFLLFFKRLKKYLFLDLKFKLKSFFNLKLKQQNKFKIFDLKKYKLNYIKKKIITQNLQIVKKNKLFQKSNKKFLHKTKKVLKSIDVYGELKLNLIYKLRLNSSVGRAKD